MIYLEGLMHKKINIWLAIIIIGLITIGIAWVISAQAANPYASMIIMSAPQKCSYDNPPLVTCLRTCPICGNLTGQCSGLYEVKALFLKGYNQFYQQQALCIAQPIPPNGGQFLPGKKCIGNYIGFGPHILKNFACYR
ncbi:MAG: hypothetical protein WC508_02190 [Patescibacteria group bacterium]